jgi:glycosyltransferase involved in cell wall biosynthesis
VGGPGLTADAQAFFDDVVRSASAVDNLQVVGHVPFAQVGRWFDGAAVVVNTSDYEGLPNTFMQAWLRGIPTLSFVRPESAPGQSGTHSCASLDEMSAELERLTTDRQAWAQASAVCRAHFEAHHTIERATQQYRDVFATVLAP